MLLTVDLKAASHIDHRRPGFCRFACRRSDAQHTPCGRSAYLAAWRTQEASPCLVCFLGRATADPLQARPQATHRDLRGQHSELVAPRTSFAAT